jgi:transposase
MSDREPHVETLVMPGAVAVVLPLLRRLGIRRIVDELCPMQWSKGATHGQVAELFLLHLLQHERRLPLYHLQGWVAEKDLGPLLGCPAEAFNDDRLGRALEAFAEAMPQLEAQVVAQAVVQYRLPVETIHWDFTHLTFTGAYDEVELVTRGYRCPPGCQQIELSLAVDENGVPLRHQVVPGNAQPHGYIESTLRALQERLGRSDLLIIGDRGVICYDLVAACEKQGARFIGPLQMTPAQREFARSVPAEAFSALSYQSLSGSSEYRCHDTTLQLGSPPKGAPLTVRALLIHSSGKAQRDADKRQDLLDRAVTRLEKIASQLNRGKYKRRDYAAHQLAQATAPTAAWVRVELTGSDGELRLSWSFEEAALAQARRLDGRYLLITNTTLTPDEVFAAYKRQHVVESNFRTFKSGLQVHPIYLANEQRIRGLVLMVILALLIYALLELVSVRREVPSEHYHKLTARAVLRQAGTLVMSRVHLPGQVPRWQLRFHRRQQKLWQDLGFPSPLTWLSD